MIKSEIKKGFTLNRFPDLLIKTYNKWIDDDPFRQSAIVAYYAILSLPALMVIILNLVGAIWGYEIVRKEMVQEISQAVGPDTGNSILEMVKDRGGEQTSIFTTIIGLITLIYGGTGVFFQLQTTLDRIWGIASSGESGILAIIKSRIKSFGFILIIGFLLLISFIATSLLSAFSSRLSQLLSESIVDAVYIIDIIVGLVFIYVLFGALFKFLPSVNIQWKAVRIGAGLTALLFIIGKYILSYYFAIMEPGSTYGAAGSIIIIMLWVSYSSLILFFGAHFTKVYSDVFVKDTLELRKTLGFSRSSVFKKKS